MATGFEVPFPFFPNPQESTGQVKKYIVSVPTQSVVETYCRWKSLDEACERTVMDDGWTVPALKFSHLYAAQAAALDLAMVSGSVMPLQAPEILITEIDDDSVGQPC